MDSKDIEYSNLTYEDGSRIPCKYIEYSLMTPDPSVILAVLDHLLIKNNYSSIEFFRENINTHIRINNTFGKLAGQLGGKKFCTDNSGILNINLDLKLPKKIGLRRTKLKNDVQACIGHILANSKIEKTWIGKQKEDMLKECDRKKHINFNEPLPTYEEVMKEDGAFPSAKN